MPLGGLPQLPVQDTPITDATLPTSSQSPPSNNGGLFSSITSNPYFSAGFGLIGVGAGLAVLRQGINRGASLIQRQLLVTLEIPSRDKSYLWFLNWMSSLPKNRARQLAVQTNFKQHDNGSISTQFSLVPGPGKHWFRYRGRWLQVERQRDGKMMDLTTGAPFETVTLTTLWRDRDVFDELLTEAKEFALRQQEGKTVIYTSWGPEWRPFGLPRRRRQLESVILDRGIKERIVRDVRRFLQNGKWYNDRGIPYRRGYLLYGPPGSGKSSFIQALAGELEYNICLLNLSERGLTDDRLNHLLAVVPERSILLLEDVDAAFHKRSSTAVAASEEGPYRGSLVTFSGLLNALDGVASSEERIIFMTTNHIEKLDAALIRPGRVDVKEYLGNASKEQMQSIFLRFYGGEHKLAEQFVDRIGERQVSCAALQGHFVEYMDEPQLAVENVDRLFR
ncbi:uncharacterized protein VTP21DRAFT_2679 [Calcarisporiella thermophila]|uniref:uncharacterized protein n=1 Tax=Calcarisporiella thermophila TaxID=911321 RepID=UPI0037434C97